LLSGYGESRFGFLSIVWALIGYFSIFDFGMGRALTKLVADRLGSDRRDEVSSLCTTALTAMFGLGIIAASAVLIAAPGLVNLLDMPADLQTEAIASLRLLALSIPFVIVSAGLVGALEAHGNFKAINLVRIAMGLLNFGAPLIALLWSRSLIPATFALALTRLLACICYLLSARGQEILSLTRTSLVRSYLDELLKFGGWITVSNLVSPLMAQLDKFVIGSAVAIATLPLYSVPSDLVSRLSFAPVAVVGVFFPAVATARAAGNSDAVRTLYSGSLRIIVGGMLPCCLVLAAFSKEGLSLWLNEEFATKSAPLVLWLSVGLLANSAARIPSAFLQATGRPDITAKLHLIELPLYGLGLWILLNSIGIAGAAIAWSGRMIVDFFLLNIAASRCVPALRLSIVKSLLWLAFCIALICSTPLFQSPTKIALVLLAAIGGIGISLASLSSLRREIK